MLDQVAIVTGAGKCIGRLLRIAIRRADLRDKLPSSATRRKYSSCCGVMATSIARQSRTKKFSTVERIKQMVRISTEFCSPIAAAKQAREMRRIGVFYDTVEETLAANGFAPNAKGRAQAYLRKAA